jgi:hypothetical protein
VASAVKPWYCALFRPGRTIGHILAHILLVVSPPGTEDDSLERSVARALGGIQSPGVHLPLVTGSLGAAAWGILAPPFEALASGGVPASLAALHRTDSSVSFTLPSLAVELTTDAFRASGDEVGSRTIWYARSKGGLLVSTSQRALIRWLGDFEPADAAVGWFVLTGSLGPGASWDRRIQALPPAASLRFNRFSRSLEVVRGAAPRFQHSAAPLCELQTELITALGDVMARVPRVPPVALSLSGGLDSSLLLHSLASAAPIDCVSWGAADALEDPRSDAAVALRNARLYEAPFRFLPIHPAPIDQAIDNFVAAGEGRVDHLTGYLDGLDVWKRLALEHQVQLLVRGDEAFGWVPVLTAADVRRSVGAPELGDYGNGERLRREGLGDLTIPPLPDALDRGAESLPTWRDRLYQEFRIPVILAALTTTKSGYVETYNPLLDARLLRVVAKLPDRERTDKRFVRRVARAVLPLLRSPGASSDGAVPIPRRDVAGLALDELDCSELVAHLPTRLRSTLRVSALARAVDDSDGSGQAKAGPRLALRGPTWLRRLARNTIAREQLGADKLLLRALLLARTLRLLRADAGAAVTA